MKHEQDKAEATYTKAQLMGSKIYRNRQDVLNVVLADNEAYTLQEVAKRVQQFMKGKG